MSNLDIARLARFALFGLLFTGPAGHFWNVALENLVQLPGVRGVLTKVAFDQVFFSPIATAIFFAVMKVAEGYNLQDTRDFLKNNLGGTIVSSWRLWPLANVVNFSCVPPSHRVVFTSAVSVVWISFMSLVANRTVAPVVVP